MTLFVKACGITHADDARVCVEAGVDAIGVNLVPGSRRFVPLTEARALADWIHVLDARVEVVAVVADAALDELQALGSSFDRIQLHGHEPPALLDALLPRAFKAMRVGSAADVAASDAYGGDLLLVDALSGTALGGTGHSFDWTLVTELARRRRLVLAGGLTPENVARAIDVCRPYGVDVASGIEGDDDPRRKDPARVRDFVARARAR